MTSLIRPEERIILALDGMNELEMLNLIDILPQLVWVKVGLELFTLLGPEVIQKLRALGKKVFLDLKFHDIPTTMSKASYLAAKTGAELITVHACSGSKSLKESNLSAIEGAREIGLPPPTLLAVTVLTSWNPKEFADELDFSQTISNRSNLLAHLAFQSGIGGCVCSPLEVAQLRKSFPSSFQLITPGIRSANINLDDQVRIMSPKEAIDAGSSKLVVGREITKSVNPQDVFKRICSQLEQ